MSKYSRQKEEYIKKLKSHSPQSKLLNASITNVGSWTGKLYPSGDITIGYKPKYKPDKQEKLETKARQLESLMQDSYVHPNTKMEHKVPADPKELESAQLKQLGFSAVNNSAKSKKTYGLKGITGYGRRCVRSAAILLEQAYGCANLAFVTVTLPSLTDRDCLRVGARWGVVVNTFLKRLHRRFKKHNSRFECVYVTELQSKRGARDGGFYPHLHLVWRSRAANGQWNVTADELRHDWRSTLEIVIQDPVGEWNATCDIQRVKKSAANYLSKYLTKGGININRELTDEEKQCLPKQWWGATTELRREVKKRIQKLPDSFARAMLYHIDALAEEGLFKYVREITATVHEGYTVLRGVVAAISYEFIDDLPGVVSYISSLPF